MTEETSQSGSQERMWLVFKRIVISLNWRRAVDKMGWWMGVRLGWGCLKDTRPIVKAVESLIWTALLEPRYQY